MKCTIKELKPNKLYYFLQANPLHNPERDGDIHIYKALCKKVEIGNIAYALFDFEGLEKNEVYFYRTINNRYAGDTSNELLNKPITLYCNYSDENSNRIIGDYMSIKGFIISDSIENAIKEYEEFLNFIIEDGIEKANKKISEGNEIDGKTELYRLELLKENYAKQINWLINKYLKN